METTTNRKPTRSGFTFLRRLCNQTPNDLVPGSACQYDGEAKSSTLKSWSHVVSLPHAELAIVLG